MQCCRCGALDQASFMLKVKAAPSCTAPAKWQWSLAVLQSFWAVQRPCCAASAGMQSCCCGWLQAEKAAQAAELNALLNQHTQQQLQLKDAFAKSDQVRAAIWGSVYAEFD